MYIIWFSAVRRRTPRTFFTFTVRFGPGVYTYTAAGAYNTNRTRLLLGTNNTGRTRTALCTLWLYAIRIILTYVCVCVCWVLFRRRLRPAVLMMMMKTIDDRLRATAYNIGEGRQKKKKNRKSLRKNPTADNYCASTENAAVDPLIMYML